jgi:hypothetical protein
VSSNAIDLPEDVQRREGGREIAALCISIALVTCSQATMPLWVGAAVRGPVRLTTLQVGQIGSAELAGIAIGILTFTLLNLREKLRALGGGGGRANDRSRKSRRSGNA